MKRQRIQSAQSWLESVGKRLLHLWEKAVQPPRPIADPEILRRTLLLNRILLILIPTTFVVLVLQLTIAPVVPSGSAKVISPVAMGFASALLIYVVNRVFQNYRLVSYLLIVIGIIAILVNAVTSDPPHLEITFLVLLPLCGTLLFSLRETILLCLLNMVLFVIFAAVIQDMPDEVFQDLLVYMGLTQLFIVFMAHQRNRLEADRQKLALAAANHELLTRLITDLSHDFRTPLAIVNTSAYLLARTDDPQARQEKLEQIIGQVQRLSRILDDILTLSRLDSVADPTLMPLDINLLLETLLQEFQPLTARKNLSVCKELMPDIPPVFAHRANMHRALSKIVENAAQYTPDGGAITVRTRKVTDMLVIEVADTGIGIAPADLPLVFDYFFRGDKARSSNEGSVGLGLSIAKRVIELYHGKIEVESVLGKGSTFRVLLPVSKSLR